MEGKVLTHRYDDIINLPHRQSPTRPRMSRLNRAAQFAPFAALTGHDAAILETGRLTEAFTELDENRKAELDDKLSYIMQHLKEKPEVMVIYFQPDSKKEGGAYLSTSGVVRRIDGDKKVVIMADKTVIPLERIFEIEMEVNDG